MWTMRPFLEAAVVPKALQPSQLRRPRAAEKAAQRFWCL